ncbi:hypothetical protein NQ318_019147 [Aromia moschata]|uniref:Uncharacterized protein n=1 Tax=Aromia moschata TaxID=1265417 RepID=A0AAV8YRB6_9CUCU|nr:hypothetical protein NQ318_019147 [Aromia moschata]
MCPRNYVTRGLLVAGNGGVRLGDVKVADVLKYYWAVVLMLAVLALMAIFIPLCGLFFCCCRCCGNCGARSLPCDKKRDLCKKIVQGTLLIILSTGLLFCVVCAFASNQQLEDGIDALPEHFKDSQKDTSTYLNSVQNQASHLLVTNYQEFSTVFTSTMNKSSEYVMQQLEIWSNATAMMTLYTFVDTLPVINSSLFTLKTDTNTLRASASQLNDAMRKVKKELLNTLYKCETDKCKDIKNNISQLQTNIDFNRLPDVSPTISKLKELDIASLQSATLEGISWTRSERARLKV